MAVMVDVSLEKPAEKVQITMLPLTTLGSNDSVHWHSSTHCGVLGNVPFALTASRANTSLCRKSPPTKVGAERELSKHLHPIPASTLIHIVYSNSRDNFPNRGERKKKILKKCLMDSHSVVWTILKFEIMHEDSWDEKSLKKLLKKNLKYCNMIFPNKWLR